MVCNILFFQQYHETVQEALEAVKDDGIIIVHKGIYEERLSITKPVALIGAGNETFYFLCKSCSINSWGVQSHCSVLIMKDVVAV